MSVKFFGQFLLERNRITVAQLLEAAAYQESRNLNFGDCARKLGYLDAGAVRKLNEEQKRTDMRIGELALKMGLLNRSQVDEVLTVQKNDHILLGEVLAQKGFIEQDVLRKELLAFSEDQKKYTMGNVPVPAGINDAETVRSMVDLTQKLLLRIARVEVKLEVPSMVEKGPGKQFALVMIEFRGGTRFSYVLAVSREAALPIATGVIGLNAQGEPDSMLRDSVKEFSNIVCGNVIARMAQKGKTVDISPPTLEEAHGGEYSVFYGTKAACYPLINTIGDLTLYIIEQ